MDTRPRLLGNRYELQAIVASGGMGRVWRAHDSLLNRPVAVKILRSEYTGNAAFLARFRAEAQHAAALHHPNIAAVFDYGEITDDVGEHLAYLVMELVEGDSLAALLDREKQLDVPRTLTIVRSTAAALAAAHATGVVHRDVKPGNVLVGRDGVVKITDFGIAWSASSAPLTQTGQVIGTAHYLSPEQAEGGKATPASDVYALGAVAYECLAGRRPFDGDSSVQIAMMQIRDEPAPLPPQIPDDVRRLVEHAMAKDPAKRFPDGAAFRDAVDRLGAGRPSPTLPVTGLLPAAGPRPGSGSAPTAVLPHVGAVLAPAGAAAGTGRRALLRAALGGLAALVLLAVVLGVLQNSAGSGGSAAGRSGASSPAVAATSPSPGPTAPSTPPAVPLVAAGYLGHPVAQVQAALTALGLQVRLTPVATSAVGAGLVTAIAPVGSVPAGSTVTVTYAVAPVAAPAPQPTPHPAPAPKHKKHGKGGD